MRFLFFLLPVLIVSCYKEKIISLPECEDCRIPVFICALTPTDTLWAQVYETASFGAEARQLSADIKISDSLGNSIFFTPDQRNSNRYFAVTTSFPIQKGWHYTLLVTLSDGRILTSETTIPKEAIPWKDVSVIGQKNDDQVPDLIETIIKCTWLVPDSNYCLIGESYSERHYTVGNSEFSDNAGSFLHTRVRATRLENNTYEYIYNSLHDTLTMWLITPNKQLSAFANSFEYYCNLNIDIDTRSSFEMYKGIIPEYTNIQGGIGFFGAYLTDKKDINLK